MLLPILLMTYTMQYEVSPLYKLVAVVSVALLFYSLLFMVFLSISHLILQEPLYGGCTSTSLIAMLLMYTFLKYGKLNYYFHNKFHNSNEIVSFQKKLLANFQDNPAFNVRIDFTLSHSKHGDAYIAISYQSLLHLMNINII